MMTGTGDLYLAQEDGGLPTTLAGGSAPGESGVSVLSMRFQGGAHLSATMRQHIVCFQMAHQLPFECRMAGRVLPPKPPARAVARCSAGIDCGADAERHGGALFVVVDPDPLA